MNFEKLDYKSTNQSRYEISNDEGVTVNDVLNVVDVHNKSWKDVDGRGLYTTDSVEGLLSELSGDISLIGGSYKKIIMTCSDTFRGKIELTSPE